MKPPTVVNYKEQRDKGSLLYIGRAMPSLGLRASPWANPFKIQKDTPEQRQAALDKYREHVLAWPDLDDRLKTLNGRTLACWCWPKPCHGDVLVELFQDRLLKWPEDADARTQLHFHLCVRGPWTDAQGIEDMRDRGLIPEAIRDWPMLSEDLAARVLQYYMNLLRGIYKP